MAIETKRIELAWEGDLRFRGGAPGGPVELIDADNAQAPGPMLQLLLAAASCSAADVVLILQKMRQPLASLRLTAEGDRREQEPRRYTALRFTWHARGDGLEEAKVRRAVELSVEKYCSVLATLAPDVRVSWEVELE